MVEKNVKIGAFVTIGVTLVGAILASVFSPVFSPLSNSIKEQLSGQPDTNFTYGVTFDLNNKNLSRIINETNPTIVSNSVTFNFSAIQKPPIGGPVKFLGFECSMDGAPFEDCVPPKSYYNLQSDAGHILQVRAKGILGNVDKTPDKFPFNIKTSAMVEGVIKDNSHGSLFTFSLDSNSISQKTNYTTDKFGIFRLEDISQGIHRVDIPMRDGNRSGIFFVPSGETIITKSFDVRNMSTEINNPTKEEFFADNKTLHFENVTSTDSRSNLLSLPTANTTDVLDDMLSSSLHTTGSPDDLSIMYGNTTIASDDMPSLHLDNTTEEIPSSKTLEGFGQKGESFILSLHQESKPSSNPANPFSTQIWLNAPAEILPTIEKVTYHLHPTFNPPNVSSFTQDNSFGISFSNWGVFDVPATVYFKNGETMQVILPKENWSIF